MSRRGAGARRGRRKASSQPGRLAGFTNLVRAKNARNAKGESRKAGILEAGEEANGPSCRSVFLPRERRRDGIGAHERASYAPLTPSAGFALHFVQSIFASLRFCGCPISAFASVQGRQGNAGIQGRVPRRGAGAQRFRRSKSESRRRCGI